MHRRARGSGEIGAAVRRPRLAVQHAAASKVARWTRAIERQAKTSLPELRRRDGCENLAQPQSLLFGAREVLRARLDKLGLHLQPLDRKMTSPDRHCRVATHVCAVLRLCRQFECVPSRWVLQVHADERSEEHTSELQSLAYLVCR